MLTSKISDQGQTTIPASVRKAMKAPPGTVLAWAVNGATAKVVPLAKIHQRKHPRYDYEAHIKSLKESRSVPDHLLNIKRSKEM